MARGVPVLTTAWVYACLEHRGGGGGGRGGGGEEWLWERADYLPFLHPRFNPCCSPLNQTSATSVSASAAVAVAVYVGPCRDPSTRMVEALMDSFFLARGHGGGGAGAGVDSISPCRRVTALSEATLVIMGECASD